MSNTIHLIIETPPLQTYAVHKLFTVLSKEILKVRSRVVPPNRHALTGFVCERV